MSKTDVMPVLKANAYGHGVIPVSKVARAHNVKMIGFATLLTVCALTSFWAILCLLYPTLSYTMLPYATLRAPPGSDPTPPYPTLTNHPNHPNHTIPYPPQPDPT